MYNLFFSNSFMFLSYLNHTTDVFIKYFKAGIWAEYRYIE
ncbi:hypothetical protein ADIARSV_0773 [Arcticibacter svalbardensis MN12-7]|uniref:Uncharacterized protein n=1 Tax=Arcticibacter svalbardensis MN12-7 TaxID=1150600 RepID=R9GWZ4_9SPHI|nr:hypothetical protein ADIARSV_0773 [Arcticibacter svalbardensis MN12-7]